MMRDTFAIYEVYIATTKRLASGDRRRRCRRRVEGILKKEGEFSLDLGVNCTLLGREPTYGQIAILLTVFADFLFCDRYRIRWVRGLLGRLGRVA
jgi:hypothetical protein